MRVLVLVWSCDLKNMSKRMKWFTPESVSVSVVVKRDNKSTN